MEKRLVATIPTLTPEFILQAMSEVYDWGLIDLNIPEAHKMSQGEGVKIAIIDSGRSEHFEVVNRIIDAEDFTDSRNPYDRNGHSTFISGLIAAEKNDQGVVGVAPKADLYFAKAMDDAGRGSPSALVKAIDWAVEKKVDIISISAGMFFDFKPLHEAVKRAYAQNITLIAAAGNTGNTYFDIAFPARYPEVIGVAAYDQARHAAPFSSRGINISFALPGVNIYSTWLENQFCLNNGTSFAAPMLTGVCALLLARHRQVVDVVTPCETPQQMLEHLKKYAVKLGEKNETGFGTVDVVKML